MIYTIIYPNVRLLHNSFNALVSTDCGGVVGLSYSQAGGISFAVLPLYFLSNMLFSSYVLHLCPFRIHDCCCSHAEVYGKTLAHELR